MAPANRDHEILLKGWLWKRWYRSKSNASRPTLMSRWFGWKQRYTRRYFVLRVGPMPNECHLLYYKDERQLDERDKTSLVDCVERIDSHMVHDESDSAAPKSEWIFGVTFDENNRLFLAADSEAEMNDWVLELARGADLQPNHRDEHDMHIDEQLHDLLYSRQLQSLNNQQSNTNTINSHHANSPDRLNSTDEADRLVEMNFRLMQKQPSNFSTNGRHQDQRIEQNNNNLEFVVPPPLANGRLQQKGTDERKTDAMKITAGKAMGYEHLTNFISAPPRPKQDRSKVPPPTPIEHSAPAIGSSNNIVHSRNNSSNPLPVPPRRVGIDPHGSLGTMDAYQTPVDNYNQPTSIGNYQSPPAPVNAAPVTERESRTRSTGSSIQLDEERSLAVSTDFDLNSIVPPPSYTVATASMSNYNQPMNISTYNMPANHQRRLSENKTPNKHSSHSLPRIIDVDDRNGAVPDKSNLNNALQHASLAHRANSLATTNGSEPAIAVDKLDLTQLRPAAVGYASKSLPRVPPRTGNMIIPQNMNGTGDIDITTKPCFKLSSSWDSIEEVDTENMPYHVHEVNQSISTDSPPTAPPVVDRSKKPMRRSTASVSEPQVQNPQQGTPPVVPARISHGQSSSTSVSECGTFSPMSPPAPVMIKKPGVTVVKKASFTRKQRPPFLEHVVVPSPEPKSPALLSPGHTNGNTQSVTSPGYIPKSPKFLPKVTPKISITNDEPQTPGSPAISVFSQARHTQAHPSTTSTSSKPLEYVLPQHATGGNRSPSPRHMQNGGSDTESVKSKAKPQYVHIDVGQTEGVKNLQQNRLETLERKKKSK